MLRKFILSAAALLAVTSLSAQVKFNDVTPEELETLAKKEQKLIFIDLYATWCGPCKIMERDVLSREDVGEFMTKHYTCAKFDIDKPTGKELSKKYAIRTIPTYLVFDLEGHLLQSVSALMTPEEFIEKFSEMIDTE